MTADSDVASEVSTPAVTLTELQGLLRLRPSGPARSDRTRWVGKPQEIPRERMFGGLLLGQALVAASRTVPEDQRIVSLQADFIAGVPTDRPLVWDVTRLSDGRSLSTRLSTLLGENGEMLFSATTRWAAIRDDLPSYGSARPLKAPDPEDLSDLADVRHADRTIPLWWRIERPVHFRQVWSSSDETSGAQTSFFRSTSQLPDDPAMRAAVFAYATDMSMLEPAFPALGVDRHAGGARILSLTHAVTFHCEPDPSTWHQVDCTVDVISHGRALGIGKVFDAKDRYVATVSQFGLIRIPNVAKGKAER